MELNTLLTLIGGVIVLALIIIAIVIRMKNNPSAADKEAAKKFLEGLEDTFYKKMLDIITNIDFTKYDSVGTMEANIICDIYDTIWDYIQDKTKDLAREDILTALIVKVLDKEFVNDFIDNLVVKYKINDKLEEAWNNNFKTKSNEAVEEDKILQDKFKDPDQYIEDSTTSDLPPVEKTEPTAEELSKLNPPKDEEEEYDPKDESMEIVDDDTYIDDKGRKRNKTTGRFVK